MSENPYISSIFFLFLITLYFVFSWRIRLKYLAEKKVSHGLEDPLRYFMMSFMWMGVFFVLHWLPLFALYVGGPYATLEWFRTVHPWSHMVGHIFMHISFAYGALVGAHFMWPRLKPYIFGWVMVMGAALGTLLTIRYSQISEIQGPVLIGGDSPLIAVTVFLGALGFLFTGIVFLLKAFRGIPGISRKRAILIGLGLILFVIGGPMNDVAHTVSEVLVAQAVVVVAVLLQAAGILMRTANSNTVSATN